MINVTVHLFGHYKDVKPEPFEVAVPDSADVKDLAGVVAAMDPKLTGLDRICRAAVNEEYSENTRILRGGDVVAFIPPMSGG